MCLFEAIEVEGIDGMKDPISPPTLYKCSLNCDWLIQILDPDWKKNMLNK